MSDIGVVRRFLAMLAGKQFGGKRDLYEVFGYERALTYEQLYAKYERQEIAQRIVKEPANAVWDFPPELKAGRNLLTSWKDIAQRTRFWAMCSRADKLCSFGRFSVLLLGLPGSLSSAATKAGPKDLLFIQPYSEQRVKISKYEENPLNERFGLPVEYEINIGASLTQDARTAVNSTLTTKKVHWTRIIHVVESPLENELYGVPRLAPVFNVLEDILKVGGGTAEMFWLSANRGMQVNVDKDMELNPDDEKALTDELDEFQHQLRRYIRTRGVEIKNLGSDVADPRGTFETLIGLLAAGTGIPQRILMGSEAGQLASEQDRANWAETIHRRRIHFAEPSIILPVIERFRMLGMIPAGGEVEIVWPDAFHQNPLERSQTAAQLARAVANFARQGQMGTPVTSKEEARVMLGLPEKIPEGHTEFEFYDELKAEFAQPSEGPGPDNTGADPNNPDEDTIDGANDDETSDASGRGNPSR